MKGLLFIASVLLAFVFSLAGPAEATAQSRFESYIKTDSLVNQDTVIQAMDFDFKNPYYYSVHVVSDSVSGANAGTCYLEFSNERGTPTYWHRAQTLTLDGATDQSQLWEGILYARKIRLYFISPSGTRKTRLHTRMAFKAVPQ